MTLRTAMVAGATGLVGTCLVDRLLADPDYDEVHVVARRKLEAREGAPGLVQHLADFDHLGDVNVPAKLDAAFCCLGTTLRKAGSKEAFRRVDHDYVVAFARAARAHGAERFLLVSALGADPDSRVFYNRVKGEAEQAVRDVGFPGVAILRPSILLGDREESRPAERVGIAVARALDPVLRGRLARYRGTPADAVAAALVAAAHEARDGARTYKSEDVRALAGF